MKENLLEVCINYKKGVIESKEAMDNIVAMLIPEESIEVPDSRIKNLVAVSFDRDPEELTNSSREEALMVAKYMYRKLLHEKEYSTKVLIRKWGLKNLSSVIPSINAHHQLIETNSGYRKIYNSINIILTEVLN